MQNAFWFWNWPFCFCETRSSPEFDHDWLRGACATKKQSQHLTRKRSVWSCWLLEENAGSIWYKNCFHWLQLGSAWWIVMDWGQSVSCDMQVNELLQQTKAKLLLIRSTSRNEWTATTVGINLYYVSCKWCHGLHIWVLLAAMARWEEINKQAQILDDISSGPGNLDSSRLW